MHHGGEGGIVATMGEGGEVPVMSPSAGGETGVEESNKSNGSASGFSQSVCNDNEESMDPFVSSGEDGNKEGGEHSKDRESTRRRKFLISGRSLEQLPCSPTCLMRIMPPWQNAGQSNQSCRTKA